MGFKHIVLLLFFLVSLLLSSLPAEELKTINVSMPTNFGTFLGEIHYSEKDHELALRIDRIIKEDLIKVINYFEYVPYDVVHFNIDPYFRVTNGNARGFPTNIINLYNFPASNLDHLISMENWLQGLVLHEFVHIVHLDQTRDYLKFGRDIFGTIAKIPAGIVPRWFTEGIAVWGESHLINGGRLNNELFNKELLIQFKKHDFCKTIDCLDDPGLYPHGELAYWAGAHFLEYLENKKPGSIKCLVHVNSSAIPFFLNNAFTECVGQKAQDLFIQFREDYETRDIPLTINKEEWGEKISNVFGSDDYQKGMVLDGDRVFKVERDKKSEALVAYDLKDEVNFIGKFDAPIADVSGMVEIDSENKFLLVSFNDDSSFRIQNKTWKLINPDTLLAERTLHFAHDPSYVLSLGGENYLTVSYWQNQWVIENNGEVLYILPGNYTINLIKKAGDQLLLKINDGNGVSSLILSDFKFHRLTQIYSSSFYYELPLIKDKFLIIREKGKLKLLEWGKSIQLSSLPEKILNHITFATYNEERVVALDNRLKTQARKAADSESYIRKEVTETKAVNAVDFKVSAAPKETPNNQSEHYPRFDHFLPHYWFLAVGNSDNLSSIGAMTTFVDPMEVNFLDATILTYPDVSKVGGSLDFIHKMVKVTDLWTVAAHFNQDYSKTDFNNALNLSRDFVLKTSYKFLYKKWIYLPSLLAGRSSTEDFISDRTIKNMGMSHALVFKALTYDDFFQYFTGEFKLLVNEANQGNSYLQTQLLGDAGWRITQNILGSIKGSYAKLFKSDFKRQVIYGGGISDYTKIRNHEFYGIPYSNAFGNEILTLRFMIDYNFWDIYRGKNMLPFFFKEAHFLFGRESLYANRIVLDGEVLRDKMVNALFVGPRLKMNLFYYVPANIDLIFSSVAHPNGNDVNQVNFNISASIY